MGRPALRRSPDLTSKGTFPTKKKLAKVRGSRASTKYNKNTGKENAADKLFEVLRISKGVLATLFQKTHPGRAYVQTYSTRTHAIWAVGQLSNAISLKKTTQRDSIYRMT